jgi:hypothetical protein
MAIQQGATATKSHKEALHDSLVLFLRERLADVRKVGQDTGLLVRIVGRAACSTVAPVWSGPLCVGLRLRTSAMAQTWYLERSVGTHLPLPSSFNFDATVAFFSPFCDKCATASNPTNKVWAYLAESSEQTLSSAQ